jgi:hypothetical protein
MSTPVEKSLVGSVDRLEGMISTSAAMLFASRLHVVAEQQILVAQVQFAVGNDRVRPVRLLATIGLVKAAVLNILLRIWLYQDHDALLGAIVESAIGQGH